MILSDNHAIFKKFILPTQRNLSSNVRTYARTDSYLNTYIMMRDEIEDVFRRMKSEGLGKFVKCQSH